MNAGTEGDEVASKNRASDVGGMVEIEDKSRLSTTPDIGSLVGRMSVLSSVWELRSLGALRVGVDVDCGWEREIEVVKEGGNDWLGALKIARDCERVES